MYTNPATTVVGSVAYAAFWGIGAYSIFSGTFKQAEGRQESQLGQEITNQALRTPDYVEASNILIFRPATPPTPVSKTESPPDYDTAVVSKKA